MRRGVWLVVIACGMVTVADLRGATTNTWLGKTADWAGSANWSAGAAPSGENAQDVLVPGGDNSIYPVLGADAAVGGSLIIGERARLSLNGHNLKVGAAIPETFDEADLMGLVTQGRGLIIANKASLEAEPETSTVTIQAGGLVNRGTVNGKIGLRIVGQARGFCIRGGKAFNLTALTTAPSPFPYTIVADGNVTVQGNLEMAGGRLVIKESSEFVVKGDLVFLGSEPGVMLVTEGNLLLHGGLRSEGSAYCAEIPRASPVWNKTEGAGFCMPTEKEGWLWLVGAGDQAIVAKGILPAFGIDKPSGKVTVAGDLHCNGLYIKKGNTLDLSQGQKLIFGSHVREWTKNPQPNNPPGPMRTCRDLINQGTIVGKPAVTLDFLVNDKGARQVVELSYRMPERESAGAAAGTGDDIDKTMPWRGPGSLSINRYDSRLRLKDGEIFLDGKPWDQKVTQAGAKPREADETPELDGMLSEVKSGAPSQRQALVTLQALTTLTNEFRAPPASVNIAPYVSEILTSPRGPKVWAVNGPLWGWGDVYALVDGDPDVGFGGSTYYDFVFAEPVTVNAVRLKSGSQILDAAQFVLSADVTGDGRYDKILGWGHDGEPPKGQWLTWGRSAAVFPTQTLSRLRLRVLSSGGEVARPDLGEVEIFSDAACRDRLIKQEWVGQVSKFPAQANFLVPGDVVEAKWPEPDPSDRVHKSAVAAFWMFGIGWGASWDDKAWESFPRLKDLPSCVKVLDEMKAKYRFDNIMLFFEGESTGVPWPSVRLKSATNAKYLAERKTALKIGAAVKASKGTDKVEDVLSVEPAGELGGDLFEVKDPSGKYSEQLKAEDLPCQRNLMKEFCEAAHERGMTVYVICRPEDMGKLYIGPKDQDPYEVFIQECVAGGADGVSLVPDEDHLLWSVGSYPQWRQFDEQTREKRKTFTPVELKSWVVARDQLAGDLLKERIKSVRKIKPDAVFYTGGARLLEGGDPYDIIGHTIDVEYLGCAYQSHIVRRWAAAAKDRKKVYMFDYVSRTVRFSLESLLQGARLIGSYRYNYIAEVAHSEDQRARENVFIDQFVKWGGTRSTRPPIAFLVSRASENWWPMDCATNPATAAQSYRAWAISDIMYAFLMKNGYTFDVYYLDQVADLKALKDYRLVVLPFGYSMPKAALECFTQAYAAGANFLVGERKGEVDEVGRPYDKPLLADLIEQGSKAGRVRFLDQDLVAQENKRSFVRDMTAIVDPLLGDRKDLVLKSYGNRIESFVFAVEPTERYVSFINWEDKEARIEVGLNLPDGRYHLLTLSSAAPAAFHEGAIDGKKTFTAQDLQHVALKLAADEVFSMYVLPAGRSWGQPPAK